MDSTVVKSMYTSEAGTMVTRKDGSTYEKKYDPDAMIYPEGGGGKAYGTKFLLAEIRDALKHKRVVLSVEHVPLRGKRRKMAAVAANPSYAEHLKEEDGKTELEYVLETSDRLLPQMSDVQALIHDAAARGKDIQHVMTTHGRLLVTPVHKVKDKETKERLPRRHPIETRKVKVGGHVVSLALVAEDGALGYEEVDATGKKHFRQLELRTVDRYAGRKPGDPWRWYGVYKLPAKYGGRTIRVSLTQGKREKFKRTEHLRAVAPPYPAYKEVYGRRNAIESLNDILDDWSNQHRRGHSVGHRRMRIGMLAFGLVINAQSLYLFNKNRDAQGAWAGPPQPVQAYPPLDQAA